MSARNLPYQPEMAILKSIENFKNERAMPSVPRSSGPSPIATKLSSAANKVSSGVTVLTTQVLLPTALFLGKVGTALLINGLWFSASVITAGTKKLSELLDEVRKRL